jgi:hypothetical protein
VDELDPSRQIVGGEEPCVALCASA